MKSLSLLINESLKNSKHNKVEAKKILKLIKAGKINGTFGKTIKRRKNCMR